MASFLRLFRRLSTVAGESFDPRKYINGPMPSTADFTFHPHFFSAEEQTTLLRCFLKKLDFATSQRRRRQGKNLDPANQKKETGLLELFEPDAAYSLEEVASHYNIALHASLILLIGPLRWCDKELS